MNFIRGKDPKEALQLGIPTYEIYRMQKFEGSQRADGEEIGFYIMEMNRAMEILSTVSEGRISANPYLIELRYKYSSLDGKMEMELSKMPLCFIFYCGNKYLIDPRSVLKKDI